jgi:ABC-type oligopeptide transport system ATPase subunit
MAVVERVSHRVTVMYLGEIVEIGTRADIFANPQHPYTRKLLAAVPVADPAQRHRLRGLTNEDIRSPIRPADYVPPRATTTRWALAISSWRDCARHWKEARAHQQASNQTVAVNGIWHFV